jgi:hypothetical protein
MQHRGHAQCKIRWIHCCQIQPSIFRNILAMLVMIISFMNVGNAQLNLEYTSFECNSHLQKGDKCPYTSMLASASFKNHHFIRVWPRVRFSSQGLANLAKKFCSYSEPTGQFNDRTSNGKSSRAVSIVNSLWTEWSGNRGSITTRSRTGCQPHSPSYAIHTGL